MKQIFWVLIVFIITCVCVDVTRSANILMTFPSFSPSHLIIGSALLKGLAKKGHNVTMISSYPLNTKVANYRDIKIELTTELKDKVKNAFNIGSDGIPFFRMVDTIAPLYRYANSTFSHPEVLKMMEEESFDLVIIAPTGGFFLAGLAVHFNCPLAILTQTRVPRYITSLVGNPHLLAANSHFMAGFKTPMTFFERLINFILHAIEFVMLTWSFTFERQFYSSNYPSPKYPTLDQVLRNTSLILSNYHFSQGGIFPYLPNVVEIGGIQIKEELSPLADDIQEFLDSADEGVIYFSFGTNLKSEHLSKEKRKTIWNAMTNSKLKVILKWNNEEDFSKAPPHMYVSKWLPQNEILAHKNTKLFVSHGGGGSFVETKFYGVPMVVVPMYGDQVGNAHRAVLEGWALEIEFEKLTEENLSNTIEKVLNNPNFADIAKKASKIYKDRPIKAMDSAIYWIEYVIRHKGASHMKFPASQMNFIEKNSLDVLVFLCIIMFMLLVICFKLIKIIVSKTYNKFLKRKIKMN